MPHIIRKRQESALQVPSALSNSEVELKNPIKLGSALGYGAVLAMLFVLIRAVEAWFDFIGCAGPKSGDRVFHKFLILANLGSIASERFSDRISLKTLQFRSSEG